MGSHNIDSPNWNIADITGLTIEDYVWLTPDSVILPRAQIIAYGTVVGANAVIIKDTTKMAGFR